MADGVSQTTPQNPELKFTLKEECDLEVANDTLHDQQLMLLLAKVKATAVILPLPDSIITGHDKQRIMKAETDDHATGILLQALNTSPDPKKLHTFIDIWKSSQSYHATKSKDIHQRYLKQHLNVCSKCSNLNADVKIKPIEGDRPGMRMAGGMTGEWPRMAGVNMKDECLLKIANDVMKGDPFLDILREVNKGVFTPISYKVVDRETQSYIMSDASPKKKTSELREALLDSQEPNKISVILKRLEDKNLNISANNLKVEYDKEVKKHYDKCEKCKTKPSD